ncbi:MAG: hypothetical protein RBG13Loki_3613 [Promethearchaeota archaeon CR_4]|nr:MAG: hypothetical protein RBG13Loki_3613 [Candidatus Lokiarchaeota archaeon CR_4]
MIVQQNRNISGLFEFLSCVFDNNITLNLSNYPSIFSIFFNPTSISDLIREFVALLKPIYCIGYRSTLPINTTH